ncbi:MAG: glycerol-3-phosphate dehydrogenase/oxidase [Bacteroidales bacterium]|nr:glycerol-3-phosphate dehydrogenase/oxidase [Bacteroidales bacterium]
MSDFSINTRQSWIENAPKQHFDILIVGGGITGAGILLDAAARGLKVALLEANDFGSGTSSKSTKLVHGGLRYLKNFEFSLVKEAGRERSVIHKLAPHIVQPQKMLLPIYKGQKYGRIMTFLGLTFYDWLAGVEKQYRCQFWSAEKLKEALPSINIKGLKAGVKYFEYKTNDARLVIENIKKSVFFGASAINYLKVLSVENNSDYQIIKGKNLLDDTTVSLKAKLVINATGAWSDRFLSHQLKQTFNLMYPTKGIHFVIDQSKVQLSASCYVELPDDRMIFAIPTNNKIYVGTTDTVFEQEPDKSYAEREDLQYLLNAFNTYFKQQLTESDIEMTWSGVRPLVRAKSSNPKKISRKEKLIVHHRGFISILGGKLTAYRLMAEKAVDKAVKLLAMQDQVKVCQTKSIPLSGGEFESTSKHDLVAYEEQQFYSAYQLNIKTLEFRKLFHTYGKNIEKIIEKVYELYASPERRTHAWKEAEVWYLVNYEMLIHFKDLFLHRTDRFYFDIENTLQNLDVWLDLVATYLHWDEENKRIEKQMFIDIVDKNRCCIL